jgi:hypothetical protein
MLVGDVENSKYGIGVKRLGYIRQLIASQNMADFSRTDRILPQLKHVPLLVSSSAYSSTLEMGDVAPKHHALSKLHSIITQKTVLYILKLCLKLKY